MYKEPIFLSPVFKERIWGGKKLKETYHYDAPYEKTGEAWVISAHEHGSSVVENGPLNGKTLNEVWEAHGELFNKQANDDKAYPLLVKIIDANDDLSVQVHPDDAYSKAIENVPYGKTECWYVLDAQENASIVLGHHAKDKAALEELIDNGKWDELLQQVPVARGDFFYVPSGTIHAIGKGIMILEIQQSSDVTYRVYDYDRLNDDGTKRELHLNKAKDIIQSPHKAVDFAREKNVAQGLTSELLIKEDYFTVYHWDLDGEVDLVLDVDFLQVSVVQGEASIQIAEQIIPIKNGQHFIIPHGVKAYTLKGKAELIVSNIS